MKYTILLMAILLAANCKEKSKSGAIDKTPENETVQIENTHPGKKLLESECYLCHNPRASEESMLAPPMAAVKLHYINENTTKEQFTEDLKKWVNDPEAESKIPDASLIYGVMPYIPYPEDALDQIAEYLYDHEIEKPAWFDATMEVRQNVDEGQYSGKEDAISGESKKNLAEIGMGYALAAKDVLGKNLMKAIQEKGPTGAVEFCNIRASSLTDSISVMNNAAIKRVSDKPRNIDNGADKEELGYIEYFKKLTAAQKDPKPIVKTEKGEVYFYYPITTNAMCLQCHGKPNEQVLPETLKALKNLYPSDQALGYGVKEVRGLWVVNFEESTVK